MTQSEQQDRSSPGDSCEELSFLSDRYLDVSLLGSGGMGKLYGAFDSVLRKPVAIKVLSSKRPDSKTVLRFQQEARLASRLQHTNIVKVLDFGAGPKQELYLIMDLVQGKTLQQFIEEDGPLSVEEAIPLLMQICDALVHAHNNGVIHRDIKPSNIMITADNRTGLSVRIVDFGLARLESRDVRITQTGDTIGTPLYISPEQIKGEEIDHRADIYSLGCVVFTILTGQPPYRGEKALDTFQKHLHDPIPGLADAGVQHPSIDELDRIVERLLAKSPDSRYQNLNELKEELTQFLSEEIVAVNKEDDASFELKIPFVSASARVPKWLVISTIGLITAVPLVLLAFALQPPKEVKKFAKIEDSHLFSRRKETELQNLFFLKEKGHWHYLDCRVEDADLRYLSDKEVTELDLNTCKVTGWGLKYLKSQPLVNLNMPESKLTDKELHHLNDLTGLKNLVLAFTWISNAGLKTVEPHQGISHLSFQGCEKLNDQSILEAVRIAPNLNSIDLSFVPITSKGLGYLKQFKNLKYLTIGNNDFKDDDLLPIYELKNIALLDISKCKHLTSTTTRRLPQFKKLEQVNAIDCPSITAGAFDELKKSIPKLKLHHENKSRDRKKDEELTKFFESTLQ